jgi:hypothetical protein
MSAFSGPQPAGAARVRRETRRKEAEARNGTAMARMRPCGHVHGRSNPCEANS